MADQTNARSKRFEVERLSRLSPRAATNLHELGMPDKVISSDFAHEDVKTTRRSYLKTVPSMVTEAMKRLESKIAGAAGLSELIAKLLIGWSRRSDLNR